MSSSSERAPAQVDLGDFRGAATTAFGRIDPEEIRRVTDPAAAVRTVHWGRNYLYEASLATAEGEVAVVVKSFRRDSLGRRLSALRKGSSALRSWRASLALRAAGVAAPEPVAYLESTHGRGGGFFVCAAVPDALESRYLFRAVVAGRETELFPGVDVEDFLRRLGELLRRLHDAHLWHRDVTIGNVLLTDRGDERYDGPLYLLDLNRTRIGRRLSRSQRMRDLCRLPLSRGEHRAALLAGYFPDGIRSLDRALYLLAHHGFHARLAIKKPLRGVGTWVRRWASRGTHAHIPAAAAAAGAADKVVWDPLSDQPHIHAGRLAKGRVRLRNALLHLREAAVVVAVTPGTFVEYRRLRHHRYREPVAVGRLGLGIHGGALPAEETLRLLVASKTRDVLLRVQIWEGALDRDEKLAREIVARGMRLVLAVPQNRDMVRQPELWRQGLSEIRERFAELAECVQIGHAINRSKWGVWNQREYGRLLATAREELGPTGMKLAGPAVIDFEFHHTAMALGWRHPAAFDVVSSLLYVDRRGAPERTQMGFDTVDKVTLLRAIIRASPGGDRPSWITEVNWPLKEGPHSPAGRHVAVGEERQADYLARYVLLAFASGQVERVYWWQLAARGYGLVDPAAAGGPRHRPSFVAFRTLQDRLEGSSLGRQPSDDPRRFVFAFERPDGSRWLAAWRGDNSEESWQPDAAPVRVQTALGEDLAIGGALTLTATPLYLDL